MRILFIDDEPIRAKPLLEAGYDVFITDNAEAIELYLLHSPFDVVCLDHDFEGKQYTGASVARTQLIEYNVPVVIHSCNETGAKNIAAILKEYEVPHTILPCYDPYEWILCVVNFVDQVEERRLYKWN